MSDGYDTMQEKYFGSAKEFLRKHKWSTKEAEELIRIIKGNTLR